jgi:hypothetical protein
MTLLSSSTCISRSSDAYDSECNIFAACKLQSSRAENFPDYLHWIILALFYDLNLSSFYQNWADESYGVLQSCLKATNRHVGCYLPSFSPPLQVGNGTIILLRGKPENSWPSLAGQTVPAIWVWRGSDAFWLEKKACFAHTAIEEPVKHSSGLSLCTRKGACLHYWETLQNWILLVVWSWSWVQLNYFQAWNLKNKDE